MSSDIVNAQVAPAPTQAEKRMDAILGQLPHSTWMDVKKVVHQVLQDKVSLERQTRLSEEILEAFERIKQTLAFRDDKQARYNVAVHTVVCLLEMSKSGSVFGPSRKVFLKKHADLVHAVPSIEACGKITALKNDRFRQQYKQFSKQMYDYGREWATYNS